MAAMARLPVVIIMIMTSNMVTSMNININMSIVMTDHLALLSLFRLVSPALPVGAYSYSQGFETAVESGWVHDESSASQWLQGVMQNNICHLDVPLLRNLYQALTEDNEQDFIYWNEQALAFRETSELRLEDVQMGRALWKLLSDLEVELVDLERPSWLAAWVIASRRWNICLEDAASGFVWSWLENQLAAAGKLVPLGQTSVQRLLDELMPGIGDVVTEGLKIKDENIGMGTPGMVMASMLHETQYSRLFRS
jgi:urease accessory protein